MRCKLGKRAVSSDMKGGSEIETDTPFPLEFLRHNHSDILSAVEKRKNLRVFCSKGVLDGSHIKGGNARAQSCEIFNFRTLYVKDIILLFFQLMYSHRHEDTVANEDVYAVFFEDDEDSESFTSFVKLRNYTGRSTGEGPSAEVDILYCRNPDKKKNAEMLSVKLCK